MNYITPTLILVIVSCFSFSQQIKLNGQISIHNSKYNTGKIEYVKLASVTAPFSKPATSDDNGQFELEFVGIAAGTSVKVQVEKDGLEIVNDYDLQRVILGRQLPLQIYLTAKGQLAIAQTELYNISKTALFAQKDTLIARLRANETESKAAMAELQERFGRAIADRYEAEQLLNDKVEEIEKRLPEFAQNLAAQNLDFASDLYIDAYEEFKKGNIEKVIEILGSSKLDQSYRVTIKQIAEGENLENIGRDMQRKGQLQIMQILNSYELKADAFNLLFNYSSAAQVYDSIIEIHRVNQLDEEKLATYYSKAAMIYCDDGKYEKAMEYNQKAIVIQEKIADPMNLDLATSYNSIGFVYYHKGNYEKSLEYNRKALAIREKVLGNEHQRTADSYHSIGFIYSRKGDYDKALKYYEKALAIANKVLGEDHPSTAIFYHSVAAVYFEKGDYDNALLYFAILLANKEEVLGKEHPSVGTFYSSIGAVYSKKGDYARALEYYEKGEYSENCVG